MKGKGPTGGSILEGESAGMPIIQEAKMQMPSGTRLAGQLQETK